MNETIPTNTNHAMKLRLPKFNADPKDKPTKYLKALKKYIMATGLDFSEVSCVTSDSLCDTAATIEWLSTKGRRDYFAAVLLYRLFGTDSKLPQYLRNRYLSNVSTRPTRGERPPLVIPSFRSEFLERFTLWHRICGIPSHLRYVLATH